MSDIVEDLLFGAAEAVEEPLPSPPIPKKTKARAEEPEPSPPDLLTQISKAIEDILGLTQNNSRRLDDIEKRLAQPVQFKTSERQTESPSAARREAERPTGPAGQ